MDPIPNPRHGSRHLSSLPIQFKSTMQLPFLLVLFLVVNISAKVDREHVGMESGENALAESTVVKLDRRTKMFGVGSLVSESSEEGVGIFDAFFASLSMIIVSEIGDETFIIAALMAMRHPKSIVLSGALTALVVMTVLSTGLGRIVPNLISRKHTNSAATVLYLFFGFRLLYIAWKSDSRSGQKKGMEEVEEKLEAGQGKTTLRRFFSRFLTPIFLELATHKNAAGVAVGATFGHTICTSIAVVGGSMLASKISQRTVASVGGLLFLGFSLSSYIYPPL